MRLTVRYWQKCKHKLKEVTCRTTLKIAGSFMSFHIPSTPLETKSLTKFAHQDRALACVNSGNTQGPGQTSPKTIKKCLVYH